MVLVSFCTFYHVLEKLAFGSGSFLSNLMSCGSSASPFGLFWGFPSVFSRDVKVVLFLWKQKLENSTTSASTQEGRMEGEKKLVLLFFGEK